jgi:hemoglobin
MPPTIFERYGGFASVRKVVSSFYDRVLDSDVLAHHFEHVEMPRLINHQAAFVSAVMGGPASYSDEHLRRVHARLGISAVEFDEAVGLLEETLEDFDFDQSDIDDVIGAVRRRQGFIITTP